MKILHLLFVAFFSFSAYCKDIVTTNAACATSAISQVSTTSLVGWYSLAGNGTDKSPASNTATTVGAPSSTIDRYSIASEAYSLNGSTQYLYTANSYTSPSTFSIGLWFKTSTNQGGMLMGFGNLQTGSSTGHDRKIYMTNSGTIEFGVYNTAVRGIVTPTAYNDGVWHFVMATFSTTNGMRLYVDGNLQITDASVTTIGSYSGYWRIGYDNIASDWPLQPSSLFFNGSVDEAYAYNGRELTGDEIAILYSSANGAGSNSNNYSLASTALCTGNTLNLTATTVASTTYAWTGPNGFSSNSQNPSISSITSAAAGVYTVVATTGGCTSTGYVNVSVTTTPTVTATGASRCGTGTLNLTGSGGSAGNYRWYVATSVTGDGLRGEYFNGINFDGTSVLTRVDAGVNFNWTTTSPGGSVNADFFSVRWTGLIEPQYSETYTFSVNSDNGRRLWVNDQLVINKWINDAATYTGTIALTAGQKYKIRLEYFESTSNASCVLSWQSASQGFQTIPSTRLYSGTLSTNSGYTTPSLSSTTSYYVSALSGNCEAAVATAVATVGPASVNLSQVSTTNLFGWYNLDGNANDASGTSNTGTAQGSSSYTTDRFSIASSALVLNGSSQYLTTNNPTTNPTSVTLGIWFKTNTNNGGYLLGLATNQTGAAGTNYDRHIYMTNSGKLVFGMHNGSARTITSSKSYNDNQWHFAVGTLSGGTTLKLYVDGNIVGSYTGSAVSGYSGYWRAGYGTMSPGWPSPPSSQYFSGTIDEIYIYHTAYTDAQVNTLYLSASGAGSNSPVCTGTSLNLTATTVASAAYSWSGPNGFTSTSQNPSISSITSAAAGVYTVSASISGCTSSNAYAVVVAATTPTVTPSSAARCGTGTVALSASGGSAGNYRWYNATSASGDGLWGEYFNHIDFGGTTGNGASQLTRIDAGVNFNWAAAIPGTGVAADTFSVRWTGLVEPQYSETYTFYVNSDNGRRLWVNDQLIIDKWIDDIAEYSGTIALTAGQKYKIRVEYFENTGNASVVLSWQSASQSKQAIPSTRLYSGNALSTASTFTTPSISSTTNYYVAALSGTCMSDAGTIVATVNSIPSTPTITAGSTTTFCSGCSVTLTSSAATGYSWSIGGGTTQAISATTGGSYTVTISDVNGCQATSAATVVTVNACSHTWTGSTSNDWSVGSNWNKCSAPTSTDDVTIPSVSTSPVINASANAHDLTINASGTLTNSSTGTLNVYGAWTNNGTYTDNNISNFTGSSAQTITGTTTFKNLTINNASGVTLNNTTTVTGVLTLTSGTLASGGKLLVNLNTAGVDPSGSGAVSGNMTVSRDISIGWHYISSPLAGATYAELDDDVTLTTSNFYVYNESVNSNITNIGWTKLMPAALSTTFTGQKYAGGPTAMIGYGLKFSAASTTLDITGTYTHAASFTTSTMSFTNSGNGAADGWHLIGNPYPSYINWNSGSVTKTNVNAGIIFYNKALGMNTGYVPAAGPVPEAYTNGGSPYVPAMQSFWIQTNSSSAQVSLTSATRVVNPSLIAYSGAPSFYRKAASDVPTLKLSGGASTCVDETVLRFTPFATNDFDNDLDLYKFKNDKQCPSMYTTYNGNDYDINSMSELMAGMAVPLNFEPAVSGLQTISVLSIENLTGVILEDKLLNTTQKLTDSANYNFTSTVGDAAERFLLRFSDATVTEIQDAESTLFVKISGYNNNLKVDFINNKTSAASISVSNILGQTIFNAGNVDIASGKFEKQIPITADGIYLVKVVADGKAFYKKVFLN